MKFVVFCMTSINLIFFVLRAPTWAVSAAGFAWGIYLLKCSEEKQNEN